MIESIKLVAVLVIYNQKIEESKSYQSLLQNSPMPFLVYDNSPKPQSKSDDPKITYIHNPGNPGVSKAYNEAIKWAAGISASHLLLLDSDSNFPENSLEKYTQAAQEFPNNLILPGMYSGGRKISPFYFSSGKTHYGDDIKTGSLKLGKQLAINAGSLLPINHLFDVRFNESLPLDWSDIYFFRRLADTSIETQHIDLEIEHGLSEHEDQELQSVKFRFDLYIKGIPIVAHGFTEKMMMYFWAKMKALKLCFKHRTLWFFMNLFKNFYA